MAFVYINRNIVNLGCTYILYLDLNIINHLEKILIKLALK